MSEENPSVVVLAGPNGAGKSTAAPLLLRDELKVNEFVNADVIAQGLSGFDPDRAALAAGRVMLERLKALADDREDFAFETTLASRTFAPWIRELMATGYRFRLVYLWVPDPDVSVGRVAQRVLRGGHHVPPETVRRRYLRGLRNLVNLYIPLATTWDVYDNSELEMSLIARGDSSGDFDVANPDLWAEIQGQIR